MRGPKRKPKSDPGLEAAIRAVGGLSALARLLGLSHVAVLKWPATPQHRVFAVADATGLAPEALRPDLGDWIVGERDRLGWTASGIGALREALDKRWERRGAGDAAVEVDLVDIYVTLAALKFVAGEKKISTARVSRGRSRVDEAARALAMGLALVAGRARATNIAGVLGVSRQNVDNAAERYLRSRDGDDPEDFIGGGNSDGRGERVFEAGRLRLAREADPALWALQRRYEAFVETGLSGRSTSA